MTPDRLLELIGQGESNSLEFKEEQTRPESLAREMVAFANTLGGIVLIGIADDGALVGVGNTAAITQRVAGVRTETWDVGWA